MNKQRKEIIQPKMVEALKVYAPTYYFIKGVATALNLRQTLIALPLGHHCHAGQFRKATITFEGEKIKEPYYAHPLQACSILISLNIPWTAERLDRLYATMLLHDTIEDCDVGETGEKLLTAGISQKVVNNVIALSKCSGADDSELNEYFYRISRNPEQLLAKLADRASNAKTLYVFKEAKLDEYIGETEGYIYDMIRYGKEAYPELSNGLTILKSNIKSSTDMAKAMKEQNAESAAVLYLYKEYNSGLPYEEEYIKAFRSEAHAKQLLQTRIKEAYGKTLEELRNVPEVIHKTSILDDSYVYLADKKGCTSYFMVQKEPIE